MDNHRFALLTELHNPRRALLQPVALTSNNNHACHFVLVGGVKDCSPRKSIESQAAWVRNRRKVTPYKEITDFVLVGLTDPDTADHCDALLPERHNPRRALLQPVLLTSNNKRMCNFVLVGGVKDDPVGGPRSSTEAQAAWVRNRRRQLPAVHTDHKYPLVISQPGATQSGHAESATAAACDASRTAATSPDDAHKRAECDAPGKRADTPIPGRRAHRHKVNKEPGEGKERRERTSNDSVMSLLS